MALSDWFTRSRSSSPVPDLRGALLAAVEARNLRAVARLFKEHREGIRASFPQWTRVPMEMKQEEAALARYGEMLVTVARLFEQDGDGSLMAALRGDPMDTPIETWNGEIAAAQALADQGRSREAAGVLTALIERMQHARGSAVDFYRPRVLGKLGIALYQAGDAAGALVVTGQARDLCRQMGDEEGVKAYTTNLERMAGPGALIE
jgi:hypothetical protein